MYIIFPTETVTKRVTMRRLYATEILSFGLSFIQLLNLLIHIINFLKNNALLAQDNYSIFNCSLSISFYFIYLFLFYLFSIYGDATQTHWFWQRTRTLPWSLPSHMPCPSFGLDSRGSFSLDIYTVPKSVEQNSQTQTGTINLALHQKRGCCVTSAIWPSQLIASSFVKMSVSTKSLTSSSA